MAAVLSVTDVASTFVATMSKSVPGLHGCFRVSCPLRERPPPRPSLTWQPPLSTFMVAAMATTSASHHSHGHGCNDGHETLGCHATLLQAFVKSQRSRRHMVAPTKAMAMAFPDVSWHRRRWWPLLTPSPLRSCPKSPLSLLVVSPRQHTPAAIGMGQRSPRPSCDLSRGGRRRSPLLAARPQRRSPMAIRAGR